MTLEQFISSPPTGYNGIFIDVDHAYGAQCWDAVELYAELVLGIPKNPWAITLNPDMSAKSAWLHYDQNPQLQKYFDKIPKDQVQRGDILVYDGHGAFTDGHIDIKLDGSTQVFEQNADPDHSPAHIANRANTYLLGGLRKKGTGQNMPDDSNAINFIRMDRDDPTYQPTVAEVEDAKKTSYKDWAYRLANPNDGDATNYLVAQGLPVTDVAKFDIMSRTQKHWAYDFSGKINKSFVPYTDKQLFVEVKKGV